MPSKRRLGLRLADKPTFSASTDDVALLLEFLEAPAAMRRQTSAQLQRLLNPPQTGTPMTRRSVPCPRHLGSYVVLPGTFAAWLSEAMLLSDRELNELRVRLTDWLAGDSETACRATESVGVTGD